MTRALVILLHTVLTFLLASYLWVTGNIDYSDYVIHKGLLAIVADHWRVFVMVVLPLSLITGWRGFVNGERMRQKKVKGLRVALEVTLIMASLGILFNIVNFYYYGPYQPICSKTAQFMQHAAVMILDKLIVGVIYGIVIGFTIFIANLAAFRWLLPAVKGPELPGSSR